MIYLLRVDINFLNILCMGTEPDADLGSPKS